MTTEQQITQLFGAAQDRIIKKMAARIAKMDMTVSEATLYEAERAVAMGAVYDDVVREIAELNETSAEIIRRAFSDADWEEYLKDEGAPEFMKLSAGGAIAYGIKKIAEVNADRLNLHLKNLTRTTANRTQEDFIRACDAAYSETVSGASDRHSAVTYAIRDMARAGVKVQYPSGHVDTVDVAAERAVRTAVSQTRGKIVEQWIIENGHDLIDVSAHAGARPSHAQWQGGRYSYSGDNKDYPPFVESTGYGEPTGLKGYNCRHEFFPAYDFMPPAYTDEELAAMAEKTVTYNGEEMPLYKANQIQRKYERAIRADKRELIGLDELKRQQPDNMTAAAEFDKASRRLARHREKLNDFLTQTGGARDGAREQVEGFGRSLAAKAAAGARRELTRERERAIIKEIKAIKGFSGAEIHLKPKETDISKLGFDAEHTAKKHSVTEADAKRFIKDAKISVTKWNGIYENYFGYGGAAYVQLQDQIIRTAYGKEQYDEHIKKLMEVLKKYEL